MSIPNVRMLPIVLVLLTVGCRGDRGPLLVHGKPVAWWLQQRSSPNAGTRQKATTALWMAARADPAALTGVIESLKDADATVRDAAVLGLLRLGRHAAEAREALRQAQADSDPVVREHAAKALQRIEGGR